MADKHETARQKILDGMCGESTYWPDTAAEALDAYVAAREQTLRQALEGIEHLVRHEWRLKDHSPVLVLNTIEQELDALAADAPAREEIQTSASRWVNAMLTEGHTQNAVWVSVQVALERAARSAPEETQT